MSLTFDSAKHEYRWRDEIVPSVTAVLSLVQDLSAIPPAVLERKRSIGVAVDRAITLSINDDLDESSVSPEWEGYFRGWQKFLTDYGVYRADFGEVQKPHYHAQFWFAGTPDLTLSLERIWWLLDVKTTYSVEPVHALQTAAYTELVNWNTQKGQAKLSKRGALYLKPNGTYHLEEHRARSDWLNFLACLTVYKLRRKLL